MPSLTHHPVANTPCLSQEQLQSLAENRLSEAQKKPLQQHVAKCALCQDALEGIRLMEMPESLPAMHFHINQKILDKTGSKPTAGTKWKTIYRVGIAASLLLATIYFSVENFVETSETSSQRLAVHESAPQEPEQELEEQQAASPAEQTEEKSSRTKATSQEAPQATAISPKEERKAPPRKTLKKKDARAAMPDNPDESKALQTNTLSEDTLGDADWKQDSLPTANSADALASGNGSQEVATPSTPSLVVPPIRMMPYKHPDFNEQQQSLMQQGQAVFNQGNHIEAEVYFRKLLKSAPQSRVANYLGGLNALYLNQPELAKTRLLTVAKRKGEVSFESVNWPGILSLLNDGNTEKAKQLLQLYSQREGLIRIR